MIKNIAIQLDGYRSKRRQTKTAITKTTTRKKGDIPRRFGCFQNGDKSKSATKPKRQHAKTATYPADLVVSKTATNQNRRQNQNGNTPKRRHTPPIWLFPKRRQIKIGDKTKTATRQNGDKSNLISLQKAVLTCILNGYRSKRRQPKRRQPKRRHIQLDFSPKRRVDLYPRRRQIQNGDTVKTATCTVLVVAVFVVFVLDVPPFWRVAVLDVSPFWLSPFWLSPFWMCRRFGVSPFWMCRRFGLSPFWRVAVLVVAVLVVAVLDLSPF